MPGIHLNRILFPLLVSLLLLSCSPIPTDQGAGEEKRLKVVATTTQVGDVTQNITGNLVHLEVLMPPGADPHSFQPTPQDMGLLTEADLILMNGFDLESFIEDILENTSGEVQIVSLSEGIQPFESEDDHEHEGAAGEEPDHAGEESDHLEIDPHVWMDPNNVLVWVANLEEVLVKVDPENASNYKANAQEYRQELRNLDKWIEQQVNTIPPENRKLVSDHATFNYFARRYGFEQIGSVLPGFSSLAEPSAQELAKLEDEIQNLGVKAIFVGETTNPNLTQRVAEDTGVKVAYVHTSSLTPPGGSAPNYLDYIRYNVNTIVEALK